MANKRASGKDRAPTEVGSNAGSGRNTKSIIESEAPADEAASLRAAGSVAEQPTQHQAQPPAKPPPSQPQTTISTSRGFLDWLLTHRLSLALTSYQTGQLILIGPMSNGQLSVFQRNFVRAMGLLASPERIYLSTIAHIWRLDNVLGRGQSAGHQDHYYDRLYVPRNAHTTGDLDIHEIVLDAKDRLIMEAIRPGPL